MTEVKLMLSPYIINSSTMPSVNFFRWILMTESATRGDLQPNIGSKPYCRTDIIHIHKIKG